VEEVMADKKIGKALMAKNVRRDLERPPELGNVPQLLGGSPAVLGGKGGL
jgi:phage gp45-like